MARYRLTVEIEAADMVDAMDFADNLPQSFRPDDLYSRPWLRSYEMIDVNNDAHRVWVKIDPPSDTIEPS